MRNKRYFIFIILYIFFNFSIVKANYIEINNKNLYFIKYWKENEKYHKYKHYFIDQILSVKINQNSKDLYAKCDLIGCKYPEKELNKNMFKKWLYYLQYKDKKYKMWNYSINYKKIYPKSYDISSKFKYKSLQEKSLSCESSVTADILSKKLNKKIREQEVIAKLPKSNYYNKLPIKENWKLIWGDPNKWFVWYIWNTNKIQAYQSLKTWYWVLEKPIKEVYWMYWLKTEQISKEYYENENQLLTIILKKLLNWNDIQLWGDYCTYPEEEDGIIKNLTSFQAKKWYNWKNLCIYPKSSRNFEWYYKDQNNKLIKTIWLNWEHAFYLLWYYWDINNPETIIVWDAQTWKHNYSKKEWLRKWKKMDYRHLIIK